MILLEMCNSEDCKLKYLGEHGPHFNEKLYVFAISNMTREGSSIVPFTKDRVDTILRNNNVTLYHNTGWDYMYVAAMIIADFWGNSIADESHMAKYIKDVIDDTDGYDGLVFNRWCTDMTKKHINIDWTVMI